MWGDQSESKVHYLRNTYLTSEGLEFITSLKLKKGGNPILMLIINLKKKFAFVLSFIEDSVFLKHVSVRKLCKEKVELNFEESK